MCLCVAAQSLMLLLVGPSLLRHRAGQVEEGASMEMSLLSLLLYLLLYCCMFVHTLSGNVNICKCCECFENIGYVLM